MNVDAVKHRGAIITCGVCGKQFGVKPSRSKKAKYCSMACAAKIPRGGYKLSDIAKQHHREATLRAYADGRLDMRGEKNTMYGKTFSEESRKKMSESHMGQPGLCGEDNPMYGKIPSEETRRKLGAAQTGDKHHNWKGGVSYLPYCPKFNNPFKRRVRAFFNNTCIVCGKVQVSPRALDVHHVTYNKQTCCDNTEPLFATLCGTCHGKMNKNRQEWELLLTNIIRDKYNGKSYFTKEEFYSMNNI